MKLTFAIACLTMSTVAPSHGASSTAEVRSELQRLIAEGRAPDLRRPNFSADRSSVSRFYRADDFLPAWLHLSTPTFPTPTPQALALIRMFGDAAAEGLDPEDYDAGRWSSRLERFRVAGTTASDVARVDLALSVSALRFVSDLHFGRVNPKVFHFGFDVDRDREDLGGWVRSRLVSGSNAPSEVPVKLSSIEPPFQGYLRAKEALAAYRKMASEGESEPLPFTSKAVKPGDSYPALARLATLLRRLRDLPDGSPASDYTGALVEAVKHFQARHGLDADGVMGGATLRALNVPLSQRIRQIELTLERWRWLPHAFVRPAIVVNIPEFGLRALDDSDHAPLQMKVVVGKAYGHRTPVFSAEMTYLIFRPYWDVPESIARNELLPKAAHDPDFFSRNHYEIVPAGSGDSRVRQAPWPDNALGPVKFLFPNEHNVYLHGTPEVELFSRSRRDFSHGCIRVEKPDELAAWVLRNKPGWTPERIRDAMNGARPLRVDLDAPIPVFIVYGTVVVTENGEVRFFDDIYGFDALLAKTLAAGRREWM
jgi:murein L,D-transpeptidase YcbB/YkuD